MKMQTLFDKRSKILIQLMLSLVLAITAMHSGKAQTTKTFTIPGKNILVSYNELPAGQAGVVTFTLTNKSNQVYTSGQNFSLALPVQAGLSYDLTDIQKRNGMPEGATPFVMVFNKDFSKDASFSFNCNMVQSSDPQSHSLFFIKK